MFKAIILSDTTVITNTNVPFTVVRNTNPNTKYDSTSNSVQITNSGYYDVLVNLVATSTAGGTITAQLYGDGIPISGAVATETVEQNGTATFTIIDNEKVDRDFDSGYAELSVRFNAGVTVNDALFLVEKRR